MRRARRRLIARPEPAANWLDAPLRSRRRDARRAGGADLRRALSVGLADVEIEAELVDGPASEAIAEVARLPDAEEIAVGSRGLGWLRGALESVSGRVLRVAEPQARFLC